MAECCGKTVTTKFCPDCGSPATASPMDLLRQHCLRVASKSFKEADTFDGYSKNENYQEQHRQEYAGKAKRRRELAERWEFWAAELSKLMEGK